MGLERLTPQNINVLLSEPVRITRFGLKKIRHSYIRCTQDWVYPKELSERQIARLGVTPLDIVSSHSPFLNFPLTLHVFSVKP